MALYMDDKSQTLKRTVSISKLEANRQNASKSNVLRTPGDQAHSRAKPVSVLRHLAC
jgi:hypothetical protein